MLIFEAINGIRSRLALKDEYKDKIPEYFEALEMAEKALEAQLILSEILNDFYQEDEEKHKEDRYSRALVIELLESIRWDALKVEEK